MSDDEGTPLAGAFPYSLVAIAVGIIVVVFGSLAGLTVLANWIAHHG